MAKATSEMVNVPTKHYTLVLSETEAQLVMKLCQHAGGDAALRGLLNSGPSSVLEQLNIAGVKSPTEFSLDGAISIVKVEVK